jgi:ureidoacrylate peracid hydrolase
MPIDPKTTALLLIEYQNDFTSEGGALHKGVKSVMESTNMLANARQVADKARAAGVTVMFAPISFAKGYQEITPEPYGILKGVVDSNAFVRGSWGAEIVDSLTPSADDIVVEGKRGLDTFASTNLDFILRSRGIKTLAVAGFLTNCCVESTARTGYEKGFSIVALSDCAATLSEEEQRFTFEKNLPMFARILTHEEFLSELG